MYLFEKVMQLTIFTVDVESLIRVPTNMSYVSKFLRSSDVCFGNVAFAFRFLNSRIGDFFAIRCFYRKCFLVVFIHILGISGTFF